MVISTARVNLVIHLLSVIQQPNQGYTNFLNRIYISLPKRQTVTCSHDIFTQLLTLNKLPKLMSVKYMYDTSYETVYHFVIRVCKRCYNFPFYYTGVVQCLEH
jgi:hypothetical protein